jgi:hypothetical protein
MSLQTEVRLLLVLAVTFEAMLPEDGLDVLFEVDRFIGSRSKTQ